jgi:predicted Zn-dependent protease
MRRLLFLAVVFCASSWAQDAAKSANDPVLRAMLDELQRSKAKLKLTDVETPYYIEYRISDVDEFKVETVFGERRLQNRSHGRLLRVVVRVGNYKQDSYIGMGEGLTNVAVVDDDLAALRNELWLNTDRAYKMASEALTQKQAALKQLNVEIPVDDFAKAAAVESVQPLAHLEVTPQEWVDTLQAASALYRRDALLQDFEASADFSATNRYLVNTEGTIVRDGKALYNVRVSGSTQAADGMRLNRGWSFVSAAAAELPARAKVLEQSGKVIAGLKELREAPMADEDYRGPVLFAPAAAENVIDSLVSNNIVGRKPQLGAPARTTGAWSAEYKSRVLPDFVSVKDDPTLTTFQGRSLIGSYAVDDDGVKAQSVSIVEKGKLVNFLMGRAPIRDFPESNGHGRAALGQPPEPAPGTLKVESSEPLAPEELKRKLIELARQHDLKYGYFVESLGGDLSPQVLRRVWVNDGHEELVRGGLFGELDTRSLRSDIVAAGNDLKVSNRAESIPNSIINPSLLFDELQVKRAEASKEKLPEYAAPPLNATAP